MIYKTSMQWGAVATAAIAATLAVTAYVAPAPFDVSLLTPPTTTPPTFQQPAHPSTPTPATAYDSPIYHHNEVTSIRVIPLN
jgi:hypothetical protein